MSKKIFISTVPFGSADPTVINLLKSSGHEFTINPIGRKLLPEELKELISPYHGLIAGTEEINKDVLSAAKNLECISRVGIGLDSVDLNFCRDNNIAVSYTPSGPSEAVAEMTIALMIDLLRSLSQSNLELRSGKWNRYFGKRLALSKIGIIGFGRIGKLVLKILQGFGSPKVFLNDIDESVFKSIDYENYTITSKEFIYKNSDIITLHIPLTERTRDLITIKQLNNMKDSAILINTSRGGIVNEKDLFNALNSHSIYSAGIDTFVNEPYSGNLTQLNNCMITSHMGSMSYDCRISMEIDATTDCINYLNSSKLISPVPEFEYKNQLGDRK